jgi:hypothetical protein
MTTGASLAVVERAVCGNNEAHEEEVDDVEDANSPDDLSAGLWDFLSRVIGLSSS